jgi:hypothetical protein
MPGFEPKVKVDLDPPKDDIISLDYLSKCDGACFRSLGPSLKHITHKVIVAPLGKHEGFPTYVAIKGTVFDVTGNKAYGPEGSYKGGVTLRVSLGLAWDH